MIHYLVTRAHRYTIDWFASCEPSLAGRVTVLAYEDLPQHRPAPGTYVFSDLERLTEAQLEVAIGARRRLRELGDQVRLLNDPATALRRYDLLRALREAGVNSFDVHRLSQVLFRPWRRRDPAAAARDGAHRPVRFPVFLREERDHTKDLSPLIHGWPQLYYATADLLSDRNRYRIEDLLAVEWCDTSDADGIFRKCGAFVVGGRIVPRSLMSSDDWVVSDFQLFEESRWDEAREYIATNPHADALRDVARIAGIDYGRIDYAAAGDRLFVWEINTNPCVIVPPDGEIGYELHRVPMRMIASALLALDGAGAGTSVGEREPGTAAITSSLLSG